MKRARFSTDLNAEESALVADMARRDPDFDEPKRRVEELKHLASERSTVKQPTAH